MPIQPTIAFVWDFDQTICPGYMEDPVFRRFGINPNDFWNEVKSYEKNLRSQDGKVSPDILYLNMLIGAARNPLCPDAKPGEGRMFDGRMPGLNRRMLQESGAQLAPYPGMPDFMGRLKERIETDPVYRGEGITLRHYIVSTGLADMIRSSPFARFVDADAVYGCEFQERDGIIDSIINFISPKNRALYEIVKGSPEKVDRMVPVEARSVPWQHLVYVGDGSDNDISCFATVNNSEGLSFGVYNPDPGVPAYRQKIEQRKRERRVVDFGPADFRMESPTVLKLTQIAVETADRIVFERMASRGEVKEEVRHLHPALIRRAEEQRGQKDEKDGG